MLPKQQQGISTKDDQKQIISFDSNQYLTGIEHLSVLYNAISLKTVLDITYHDFKSENPYHIILHPYLSSAIVLFGYRPVINTTS